MPPQHFLVGLVLLLTILTPKTYATTTTTTTTTTTNNNKPNIIFFLVDDLGFGDVFNSTLPTPNIDELGKSGQVLNQLYVSAPVCTPSRASILTGRVPSRTGMTSDLGIFRAVNSPATPDGLPHSELTIAELLKEKGQYTTKMIGKWHLGVNKNECGCAHKDTDPWATGREERGKCGRFFGWRCFYNWVRYESGIPFLCGGKGGGEGEEGVSILKPVKPFNSKTKVTDGLELCTDCSFQNGHFLPTQHGFDSYYGMPVTNVESCDPLHTIYSDRNAVFWLLRNQAPLFVGIGVVFFCWVFITAPSSSSSSSSLEVSPLNLRRRRHWVMGIIKIIIALLFVFGALYYYVFTTTLISRNSCVLYRDNTLIEQPVQLQNLTVRFTKEAVGFVEKRKEGDDPFFLFMSYVKVHTALFTSPTFTNASKNHGEFGDNVMEMDWSVGEILKSLKKKGIFDNTLIIFTSDNGPFLERGERGGFQGGVRSEGGVGKWERLKGGKGQTWEGGVRVPGIISWPKKIKPGVIDTIPFSTMDFFSTMLSAAEIPLPKDRPIDGIDLLPYFTGSTPSYEDELNLGPHGEEGFPLYCGGQVTAFRVGRYKAHYKTPTWEEGLESCPTNKFILCACGNTYHNPPLIYDIVNDPGEHTPLPKDSTTYETALNLITKAKEQHESTLTDTRSFPRPAEGLGRPWLMPCCNPPFCECVEGEGEEE